MEEKEFKPRLTEIAMDQGVTPEVLGRIKDAHRVSGGLTPTKNTLPQSTNDWLELRGKGLLPDTQDPNALDIID